MKKCLKKITKKQTIKFFRDPFKLVPINNIAEIADKFTRNEIMTSNEIRQIIGMKPSDDPKADQLINSNISQSKEVLTEKLGTGNTENIETTDEEMTQEDYEKALADLDDFDNQLDELEGMLNE